MGPHDALSGAFRYESSRVRPLLELSDGMLRAKINVRSAEMCLSGKVIIAYLEKNITPFLKHPEPEWEQEGLVLKAGSSLRKAAKRTAQLVELDSSPGPSVLVDSSMCTVWTRAHSRSCLRAWMWKRVIKHNLSLWKWVSIQRSVKGSGFLDADFLLNANCGFLMSLLSLFSVFNFLKSWCLLPIAVCSLPERREVLGTVTDVGKEKKPEAWEKYVALD